MITIIQGMSKKLSIVLKDDFLVVQNPNLAKNIMLELHHESRNKVLVTYGTDETIMDARTDRNGTPIPYSTALIRSGTNYVDFFVEAEHTALFPPGKIIGTFTITYEDAYFEGDRVIKARGALFNVIM